jgi:hypothetical protein
MCFASAATRLSRFKTIFPVRKHRLPTGLQGSINELARLQPDNVSRLITCVLLPYTEPRTCKMNNEFTPRVGDWYQNISGENFEIVALDDDEATLEIQYFDGAVEEVDFDSWYELEIQPIEPPEDWSGSMDIEREDYGVDLELTAPNDKINPLDEFE